MQIIELSIYHYRVECGSVCRVLPAPLAGLAGGPGEYGVWEGSNPPALPKSPTGTMWEEGLLSDEFGGFPGQCFV